jgi:hypothetical protein
VAESFGLSSGISLLEIVEKSLIQFRRILNNDDEKTLKEIEADHLSTWLLIDDQELK